MPQSLPQLAALLALAACQAPRVEPLAQASRLDAIELSHRTLTEELQGVRDLLGARRMGAGSPNTVPSQAIGRQLEDLAQRVTQLQAQMASSHGTSTANAGFAKDRRASEDQEAAAIQMLGESLKTLEKSHAIHCENIANASVPGYKRRTLIATSALDDTTGLRIAKTSAINLSMNQGVLELTGNQLDFGVEGSGFFELQLPDGSFLYTRNGSFRQDFNGRLVTQEGYLLTDQVTIPESSQGVSVSRDGQVFSHGDGTQLRVIGTIRLHLFHNPADLGTANPRGFQAANGSGPPVAHQPGVQGAGIIRQGYIERANVEITQELIDMQLIERQANAARHALASFGIYMD